MILGATAHPASEFNITHTPPAFILPLQALPSTLPSTGLCRNLHLHVHCILGPSQGGTCTHMAPEYPDLCRHLPSPPQRHTLLLACTCTRMPASILCPQQASVLPCPLPLSGLCSYLNSLSIPLFYPLRELAHALDSYNPLYPVSSANICTHMPTSPLTSVDTVLTGQPPTYHIFRLLQSHAHCIPGTYRHQQEHHQCTLGL